MSKYIHAYRFPFAIYSMESYFAVPWISLCGCVSISSILCSIGTQYSPPLRVHTMCRILFGPADNTNHKILVFYWSFCVGITEVDITQMFTIGFRVRVPQVSAWGPLAAKMPQEPPKRLQAPPGGPKTHPRPILEPFRTFFLNSLLLFA